MIKMAMILPILLVLSLHVIVDAIDITFVKVGSRIYIETDPERYGMYGQIKDGAGSRIVVVNDDKQYQQSATCVSDQQDLSEVKKEYVEAYHKIRENYLKAGKRHRGKRIGGDLEREHSNLWSIPISSDKKEYSVTRITDEIHAFSSQYFPSKLAKVIIDKGIIVFVHDDGHIVMKLMDCLFPNEKILIKGLKKINTGDHLLPRVTPVGEEPLANYLKKHPIDEFKFYSEQEYIQPERPEKKSWKKLLLPSKVEKDVKLENGD